MSLPRFKLRTHGIKIVKYLVQMEGREFRRDPKKNVIKRRLIRCVYSNDRPSSCLANSVTKNSKQKMIPLGGLWWVLDIFLPVRKLGTFKSSLIKKENCVENLTRWGSVTFSKLTVFRGISHLVHFSFFYKICGGKFLGFEIYLKKNELTTSHMPDAFHCVYLTQIYKSKTPVSRAVILYITV
jgi:hypothetical protein